VQERVLAEGWKAHRLYQHIVLSPVKRNQIQSNYSPVLVCSSKGFYWLSFCGLSHGSHRDTSMHRHVFLMSQKRLKDGYSKYIFLLQETQMFFPVNVRLVLAAKA
jgi:hypothetical protein